jgi:hypothetical protein
MIKKKSLSLLVLFLAMLLPFKALAYSAGSDDDLLYGIIAVVIVWLISGIVILLRLLFKRSKTLFILGYAFALSIALLAIIALSLTGGLSNSIVDGEFNEIVLGILLVAAVYALLVYVFGNYVNRESKEAVDSNDIDLEKKPDHLLSVMTAIIVLYEIYSLYNVALYFSLIVSYGGLQNSITVIFMVLRTILALTAIVLFARNHKWGWQLMFFYLVWTVVGNLTGLVVNLILYTNQFGFAFGYLFELCISVLFFGSFIFLLLKPSTLLLYSISKIEQRKTVLISLVTTLIFIAILRLSPLFL